MADHHLTIDTGIATITFDNPPLNLMTTALMGVLEGHLDTISADPTVRVLILTGSRRAFGAGSDVREFPAYAEAGNVLNKKLIRENDVFRRIDHLPIPTIAAIHGLAFGGGLELASACDLIVVDEDARLALPEIKLGVFPGSGGSVRISRRIGEARAKEMMFLGEPIDAATALSWGLINRVAPSGKAMEVALDFARQLIARPKLALSVCKTAVDLAFDVSEDEAIARTLLMCDLVSSSAETQEGVRAFFAKEAPDFNRVSSGLYRRS
jgi:enoyl-CoA hydratase